MNRPPPPPIPASSHTELAELFRLAAVLELLFLVVCGVYLFQTFRSRHPDDETLRRATYPYGIVLLTVAAGVIANYLSPIPPTPGVKLLAIVGAGCSIAAGRVTLRAMRHRD